MSNQFLYARSSRVIKPQAIYPQQRLVKIEHADNRVLAVTRRNGFDTHIEQPLWRCLECAACDRFAARY